MDVIEAMRGRHAVRAYLARPVARETVTAILEAARFAPSGVNSQPWRVTVVTGAARERLGQRLAAARRAGEPPRPDYDYYPRRWREPYRSRRKACGLALYGALGIGRDDRERQMEAWCANYFFFGAPVGLLFHMDRDLATGSFIDMGMFMQNVMLAARAQGLATCPQASLAEYPDLVRAALELDEDQLILCGMALGFENPEAPVNRYRLEREPVAAFTRFVDA